MKRHKIYSNGAYDVSGELVHFLLTTSLTQIVAFLFLRSPRGTERGGSEVRAGGSVCGFRPESGRAGPGSARRQQARPEVPAGWRSGTGRLGLARPLSRSAGRARSRRAAGAPFRSRLGSRVRAPAALVPGPPSWARRVLVPDAERSAPGARRPPPGSNQAKPHCCLRSGAGSELQTESCGLGPAGFRRPGPALRGPRPEREGHRRNSAHRSTRERAPRGTLTSVKNPVTSSRLRMAAHAGCCDRLLDKAVLLPGVFPTTGQPRQRERRWYHALRICPVLRCGLSTLPVVFHVALTTVL
ncbi:PREDICTED: uncharacterized protein LOC106148887 [Chinchilla lanigera]|uniref:uncharacterized protein LOC106148887 n=1 Tax=Chinchilla lanigera TaxID=34839 RepID=UPI0006991C56|nr:PREDICTED: uncharacterized protein LOC106148887 [Chinchilla lanigera]